MVQPAYFKAFRNIAIDRTDGVLEARFHTDGDSLRWGADPGSIHEQLGEAFHAIGNDPDNRVVILTGTGADFCRKPHGEELTEASDFHTWHRIMRESRAMFMNLLDIDVPVISAINGPATIHSELPILADIVLATETVRFRDTHMKIGVVPGDGCHAIWNLLLGRSRGHYFLLTGETLSVERAYHFGIVHEILAQDALMDRARAIAAELAAKPLATLRYTRMLFAQPLKESLQRELGLGLALEGLTTVAATRGAL